MLLLLLSLLMVFSPQSVSAPVAQKRTCTVDFEPAKPSAKAGEKLKLHIMVRGTTDLFSAPFYLVYDPEMVSIEDVVEGDFLNGDGKRTVFLKSIQPEKGQVIIGLARLGDVGGRSGSGKLVDVKLAAKKAGTTQLSLQNLEFRDSQLRFITVTASVLTIIVN